jgi:hypothetical protein
MAPPIAAASAMCERMAPDASIGSVMPIDAAPGKLIFILI